MLYTSRRPHEHGVVLDSLVPSGASGIEPCVEDLGGSWADKRDLQGRSWTQVVLLVDNDRDGGIV